MTLSRRGFLLGSAAAVVAASPVVRAIAVAPIYGGEMGILTGIRFPACPHDDMIAAIRYCYDEVLAVVVQRIPAESFYLPPSLARDLTA